MKQYLVAAAILVGAAGVVACTTTVIKHPADTTDPDPGTDEDGGDGSVTDPDAAASCPAFGKPSNLGKVTAEAVDESSGIVASRQNPDVFWIHNDSGDVARTFAVNKDGELLATLSYDENKPEDVEDIALEETADGANLYLADIGDNDEVRKSLTIHRFAEPKLDPSKKDVALTVTSEKMTVVYEDGAHNAETLLFDPNSKELFIATKKSGGPSYIHRLGAFQAGKKVTTTKIATVDLDWATGGDISRDGHYVAIRSTTKTGWLWAREEGEDLADMFKRTPCSAPIASEAQGEALGWLPDTTGYVTISEGATPTIHQTLFK